MYRAAEWVVHGSLAEGFAMDAILLCAEGVGDVIGHLEVGFSAELPVHEVVIMQELDVRYEEWSCAGHLDHVLTWL